MSLANYIKDTKVELTHVSWPTPKQVTAFTVVVVASSLIISGLLGAFDAIYVWGLEQLISKFGI